MVCKPCVDGFHNECAEVKRQISDLSETEKAGSSRCDCQHHRRILGRLLDARAPL